MNSTISIPLKKKRKSRLKFLLGELKPRGKMFTWFNVISIPIMILGLVLIVIRFWKGIGSITNLTQEVPWGLWITIDLSSIALAGGAFSLCAAVYLIGLKR